MQFLIDVLATTTVTAGFIAALGYMFRATLGEWLLGSVRQKFAKELEQHKANLKSVADTNLARLTSELHVEATRQQIRFSGQYAKAAEAVVGIHARLDDTFSAVANHVSILECASDPPKAERRQAVNKAIMELRFFEVLWARVLSIEIF